MHKRIVQIQVRETAIPRPKEARVPNGAAWIGADMTEASRGRRDELWRDVVEDAASGAARAHEVAGPLHEVIRDCGLPAAVLDALIAARRWLRVSRPRRSPAETRQSGSAAAPGGPAPRG